MNTFLSQIVQHQSKLLLIVDFKAHVEAVMNQMQLGVAFFCAAMYVFILRNGRNNSFLIPSIAFLLIFAVNKTGVPSVYLIYACLFYYHIFILYKLKKTETFISFIPFALCDILVAANYINPSPAIRPFIWMFYGISQMLIFTGGIQKKQCILHYRQN